MSLLNDVLDSSHLLLRDFIRAYQTFHRDSQKYYVTYIRELDMDEKSNNHSSQPPKLHPIDQYYLENIEDVKLIKII